MPKKGKRTIEVDGVRYRCLADGRRRLRRAAHRARRSRPREGPRDLHLHETQRRVSAGGSRLSHAADTMPPYVVRQTILHALSVGWAPHSGGGLRELGNRFGARREQRDADDCYIRGPRSRRCSAASVSPRRRPRRRCCQSSTCRRSGAGGASPARRRPCRRWPRRRRLHSWRSARPRRPAFRPS